MSLFSMFSKIFSKKPKCPYCGSKKIHLEEKGFRKRMLLLGVLGAAIESKRSKELQYRCDKCGETWDD